LRRRTAASRKRVVVAKRIAKPARAAAGLQEQLGKKTRELNEALEQQAATADVLRVISSSPGELEPVFQAMLENATRICDAKIGILFRYEDNAYSAVSLLGVTPAYAEYLNRAPIRPSPATGLGRVAAKKQTVHIADTRAEPAYADRDPFRMATAELGGARSLLNVPMVKDGELIGAIGIYRQEERPFTERQVALVTSFAAQAVIAIENTRLLNELRQSLEQQTATADVLRVISSSPGELQPVFQIILENATRICGANFGGLSLRQGDAFRAVAMHGVSAAFAESRQRDPLIPVTPGHNLERLLRTKDVVHVPDLAADMVAAPIPYELAGARALLNVPLLKDNEVIGSILIYRHGAGPFAEKQIESAKNFAAQAVIAMENARLLSELRDSLEQQTATSQVLSVISSSPGELEPVFQAVVENATRICDAKSGFLFRAENDGFRIVAAWDGGPTLRGR
jgi:GAF domain-containing protein